MTIVVVVFVVFRSASLNEKEVPAPPSAGLRRMTLFRSVSESHEEPVPATPVKSPATKQKPGWFFKNLPLSNPNQTSPVFDLMSVGWNLEVPLDRVLLPMKEFLISFEPKVKGYRLWWIFLSYANWYINMSHCCNSTGHRKVASSGSAFFGLLPTSPSLFRSMTMSGTRHGLLPSVTSPTSTRRRSSVSGGVLVFFFLFCLLQLGKVNYCLCQPNLVYPPDYRPLQGGEWR